MASEVRRGPRRRIRVGPVFATFALAASLFAAAAAAPAPFTVPAGAAGPDLTQAHVKLTSMITGLSAPTAIATRYGDYRLFVAEQSGAIKAVINGVARTVLTVPVLFGPERGVLGLAFTPDGSKLYVDHTGLDGNTRVDEYTMNGTAINASSKRQVLYQTQPFQNHNGGQLAFGPDGMLYIAFGDGGGAGDSLGNSQNLGIKLGKILRIDPRPLYGFPYRIPAGNPFATTVGAKKEIWMYGLRNPWKFSFDKANGDMWIGDVGQNAYEEVDFAAAGAKGTNWGWNLRVGFHQYTGAAPAGAVDPVLELAHTAGACAVIGGYVYRGNRIANLNGAYLYSDFCQGKLLAAVRSGGVITATQDLGVTIANPTAFGQGGGGEVYVTSHSGTLYRIDPA